MSSTTLASFAFALHVVDHAGLQLGGLKGFEPIGKTRQRLADVFCCPPRKGDAPYLCAFLHAEGLEERDEPREKGALGLHHVNRQVDPGLC